MLERFQVFERVDMFELVESGRVTPAALDHAPPLSPARCCRHICSGAHGRQPGS